MAGSSNAAAGAWTTTPTSSAASTLSCPTPAADQPIGQPAPKAAPTDSISARWKTKGNSTEKPIMTAANPPTIICPSAPILKSPARNPIAIPKAAKISGVDAVRVSDKADIENNEWRLENVKIFFDNGKKEVLESLKINTNFNRKKLNSIFSNLTSLNLIQLINLSEDYKKLGFSSNEIKSHILKLYSFPILISIMATIGAILVLSFSYKRSKFFNLSIGIISSVIIYYINYFFNLLGITEKTSILLSICSPLIILILFCFILLVKINEK